MNAMTKEVVHMRIQEHWLDNRAVGLIQEQLLISYDNSKSFHLFGPYFPKLYKGEVLVYKGIL